MRILPALLLLAAPPPPIAAEQPVPPPPRLEATAWVLVDQSSGQVLAGHRANERDRAREHHQADDGLRGVPCAQGRQARSSTPRCRSASAPGVPRARAPTSTSAARVPVEVLIQGMIVQSGNDATIALAEAIAGTEDTFAALMNQYAERLGMAQSHFQNSTGLPGDNHKMSAADMAKLARAIIREFPEYYRWYSQREFTWNNIRQPNRNGLLARDPSVDGVKTGMTEAAGYCLVSSAKRDGMRLIAVVTGTKSMKAREDASLALLNYGFNFFETRALKKAGEELAVHRVYKAPGGRAAVGLAQRPRGHAAARPGGARRVRGRARAARVRAAHEVRPRRRRCARWSTARSSPRRRSAARRRAARQHLPQDLGHDPVLVRLRSACRSRWSGSTVGCCRSRKRASRRSTAASCSATAPTRCCPVYGGRAYRFDAHMERLDRSLRRDPHGAAARPRGLARGSSASSCTATAAATCCSTCRSRAASSRSATTSRSRHAPDDLRLRAEAAGRSRPPPSSTASRRSLPQDIRWSRCDIKSTSLLGNVLLRWLAADAGRDGDDPAARRACDRRRARAARTSSRTAGSSRRRRPTRSCRARRAA